MAPSQDSMACDIQQRPREREDSVVSVVGTSDEQGRARLARSCKTNGTFHTEELDANEPRGNAIHEKFQGHGTPRESLGWLENFLQ